MSNDLIKYYFKESTNQILVSGSSTKDGMNALLTSSKNPIAVSNNNLTAKISSLGVDTSYVVQNGDDTTEIPIGDNQELWVYRGYNQDGGTDGDTYRYNPHLHRAYKAYILTETGSGIPSAPYLPVGSPYPLTSKFKASSQAIVGNEDVNTMDTQQVSGSFEVFNSNRGVHPLIQTNYTTLTDPPAAGAQFIMFEHDRSSTFFPFRFSTETYSPNLLNRQIRFNDDINSNVSSISETYISTYAQIEMLGLSIAISGAIEYGHSGGKLKVAQDNDADNYVEFNILTSSLENEVLQLNINGGTYSSGFSNWSNQDSLSASFENYDAQKGLINQSQNTVPNNDPNMFSDIVFSNGINSYTSSAFPTSGTQGQNAVGQTLFGLYTDLNDYIKYEARHVGLSLDDIRVFFTSSDEATTGHFFDLPSGKGAKFTALVGTVSQSGYTQQPGESFNPDGTFSSNTFTNNIIIPNSNVTHTPPNIFSTRWNDVYISYSSSLSSSIEGLYIFNQLPTADVQVTASMFITAWTGSDDGAKYGAADYGTDVYGEGEAGDGPTWQTASIRIYTGSYPNSVPTIDSDFVTESAFMSTDFHINGQAITMSYLIPSQSVSIKDCLSISLAVSSGSAAASTVENSLVVPNYELKLVTVQPNQDAGDGLVPTFVDNAFSGSDGFSNAPDCQPLLNNVNLERRNPFFQVVNYSTNIYYPLNFDAIISGSALKSTVPYSNYRSTSFINIRYRGSRSTANSVNQSPEIDILPGYSQTYGYGSLPVVDYQRAYFGYAQQVTDPYPVINNKVQFNLKYLINDSGDALQPNLSPYTAFDVEEVWDEGGIARIGMNQSPGSSQYNLIDGFQTTYKVAKEAVPVIYSQTASNGYSNFIPVVGAGATEFQASFLQYGYQVQGKAYDPSKASVTNTSGGVVKDITYYNILSGSSTIEGNVFVGNMTISSASRYGMSGSDVGTIYASQSFVLSNDAGNPGPEENQSGSGAVQYANPGELYFNDDIFAINDSNGTTEGDLNVNNGDLSSAFTLNANFSILSTAPHEYRWDAGGTWDSSDYTSGVMGYLYAELEYTDSTNLSSNNVFQKAKIVNYQPPSMTIYYVDNTQNTFPLASALGSDLQITDTRVRVNIHANKMRDAIGSFGRSYNEIAYTTFNFFLSNTNQSADSIFKSRRRYRIKVRGNYNNEPVDAPRNYWNPQVKPQQWGGQAISPTPEGPYVNFSLNAGQVDPLSTLVDNALNAPYWVFPPPASVESTGELTVGTQLNIETAVGTTLTGADEIVSASFDISNNVVVSETDTTVVSIAGPTLIELVAQVIIPTSAYIQQIIVGTILESGVGFNNGNLITISQAELISAGFTGATVDAEFIVENDNLNQISPASVIMMSSSLGNETYGKNYIPGDLTYNPGPNVRFPGGLEPADTAFPKYDLIWQIEQGDEIRFENNEDYVYTVQKVIDPSQAQGSLYSKSQADDPADEGYDVTGQLQVYLDREVIPSIDKNYFLIRRYITSPTVIYINKLFPYGSLPSKKEFVPSQNIITKFLNSAGDAQPIDQATTSSAVPEQSGSIMDIYNPLLKSDNLPSAFVFPEYPTAAIELDPDKALQDLRDKKLIE